MEEGDRTLLGGHETQVKPHCYCLCCLVDMNSFCFWVCPILKFMVCLGFCLYRNKTVSIICSWFKSYEIMLIIPLNGNVKAAIRRFPSNFVFLQSIHFRHRLLFSASILPEHFHHFQCLLLLSEPLLRHTSLIFFVTFLAFPSFNAPLSPHQWHFWACTSFTVGALHF